VLEQTSLVHSISCYMYARHLISVTIPWTMPSWKNGVHSTMGDTIASPSPCVFLLRVCSVSVPRNENENKNKFDGIGTVLAVTKLSNTVTQCLSVNLWELIALSALHYASSSTRNTAVTIITSCSICYKCYWCCYYPLCFPFVLVLPHFFTGSFFVLFIQSAIFTQILHS